MNVWAVANQKGGVGKTTTAVSLAGLLAGQGQRCLLVDLDPHGSLTSYFGCDPDLVDNGTYTLFERAAGQSHTPIASLIEAGPMPCLHFLPASTSLATLDRRFVGHGGMGLVLKRSLASLDSHFDHVLLDCPPVFGILMLNALAACTKLIVPVQTDFLALKGLERMMHTLKMIAHGGGSRLQPVIVPTQYDQRTRSSRAGMQALNERYPGLLSHEVVPVDTKFRDASREGKPITSLWPNSRGAVAYVALLAELSGAATDGVPAAVAASA